MQEKRRRRHLHAVETNVTEKIKRIYLFLFLSYAHRDFSKSSESFHDIMYYDKKKVFFIPSYVTDLLPINCFFWYHLVSLPFVAPVLRSYS